ncbi:hypothetical protein [Halochromatium salexigens]|uniref:Lipoprotein n=1 Tax=Halochromatium salexigens TaxID=49447 RepID=A0AAJ0UH14_HALSE|nr:hypothetical protein [Halochromatium salexigens]MBK5931323.1 hypothetical protein [Halochromatium salexigens]
MKQATIRRAAAALGSLLIGSGLLAGCANPGEDVRVRLCKDLVAGQLGTTQFDWTQVSTKTPGYQDAIVSLRWSNAGGDESAGSATCAYPYNAVEDTAQQLADPLSAYATSPSEVLINGETLRGQALADAVAQAMQRQGRELIDAASETIGQ